MQRIVINVRHGGFGLSDVAQARYQELVGTPFPEYDWEAPRDCEYLVQTVQELGEKANGPHARLKIVEVPDGVDWTVMEYDGMEWVAEAHRTWS